MNSENSYIREGSIVKLFRMVNKIQMVLDSITEGVYNIYRFKKNMNLHKGGRNGFDGDIEA